MRTKTQKQKTQNNFLSNLIHTTLHDKYFEPVASTRDRSVREMKFGPHHIRHRFEFKGAISAARMFSVNIAKNNALFERLKNSNKIKIRLDKATC